VNAVRDSTCGMVSGLKGYLTPVVRVPGDVVVLPMLPCDRNGLANNVRRSAVDAGDAWEH